MSPKVPSDPHPGTAPPRADDVPAGGRGRPRPITWLQRHPRAIFAAMVVALVLSIALAATVMRPRRQPLPGFGALWQPFRDEATGVQIALARLAEMAAIKADLDSLSKRDSLSAADSVRLRALLRRLNMPSYAD